MIKFKSVNKKNYEEICNLNPGRNNKKYIASNAESIVEFIYEGYTGEYKGIYLDDKLVGFFMLSKCLKPIYLHRFMIDKIYQNKGIGSKTIDLLINYIQNKYKVNTIYLSTDNPIAQNLYLSKGFKIKNDKQGINFFKKHQENLMVLRINK